MGWRFRKNINLGLGFKVNISKNGIGYSWGVPGYRTTKKANGGFQKTYFIPGSGLSYVQHSPNKKQTLPRANSMERYNLENSISYPIKNGKINALTTKENLLFIDRINKIKKRNLTTSIFGFFLFIISSFLQNILKEGEWEPIVLLISIILIFSVSFINSKRFVLLDYTIDDEVAELIKKRTVALYNLSRCSKIWNINSYQQIQYSKVNAGCNTNLSRKSAKIIKTKNFKYIKFVKETELYQLKIGTKKYIFLPDKIFVVGLFKVGALKYGDISISIQALNFVETSFPPSDAKFLYNTWQYVNINGTPDRRFKNNRKLPVYEYAKVLITSPTGLNVHLLVSSLEKASFFKQSWIQAKEIL